MEKKMNSRKSLKAGELVNLVALLKNLLEYNPL